MIRTKVIYEEITSSDLTKKIFTDAMEANKDLYDPTDLFEIDPQPKRNLTEYEFYLTRCGFTLSHLLSILDQSIKIPAYIAKYCSSDFTKKYGITRIDDLVYHYENYIIKLKSIEDRALIFINAIFHFGLNSRDVNYNLIIKNSHISSNSNLLAILKKLHKKIDQSGNQRNRIIHQNSIADPDLRKIEGMLILSRSATEIRNITKSRYMALIKKFVEVKVPEIENNYIEILGLLKEIFNLCLKKYQEIVSNLNGE